MILDTSVLLSILFQEDDSEKWLTGINRHIAEGLSMSVANYLEAVLRVDAMKDAGLTVNLIEIVETLGVEMEPVTINQMLIAREANILFGKNAKSKAKLNYGDLFAYALAKDLRKPLLYKGNDFLHTGIYSYRFDKMK
jgi:ribonuclease VapC